MTTAFLPQQDTALNRWPSWKRPMKLVVIYCFTFLRFFEIAHGGIGKINVSYHMPPKQLKEKVLNVLRDLLNDLPENTSLTFRDQAGGEIAIIHSRSYDVYEVRDVVEFVE